MVRRQTFRRHIVREVLYISRLNETPARNKTSPIYTAVRNRHRIKKRARYECAILQLHLYKGCAFGEMKFWSRHSSFCISIIALCNVCDSLLRYKIEFPVLLYVRCNDILHIPMYYSIIIIFLIFNFVHKRIPVLKKYAISGSISTFRGRSWVVYHNIVIWKTTQRNFEPFRFAV